MITHFAGKECSRIADLVDGKRSHWAHNVQKAPGILVVVTAAAVAAAAVAYPSVR